MSLSQKLGNYICFELSLVKNVECELKIQTTHFNTVPYSERKKPLLQNIHVCLLPSAKPPQRCPNSKTVQKQREERAQGVHSTLKTPRFRHMGLQCGAVGTSWFTFSETVFDGWNLSEKIHLDTRYPRLSTRTLRCDQRHSLLMLYICKSQHIVFLTGLWDFGADDPPSHFTKPSAVCSAVLFVVFNRKYFTCVAVFIMYMQYCVCHSMNINSRFVRRQTTPLRCVHRSDLHTLTTHKSCGVTLFNVGAEPQTIR